MPYQPQTRNVPSPLLRRVSAILLFLLTTTFLSACEPVSFSPTGAPSVLDPRGPGAARIADLWWVMLVLALLVFALVLGILLTILRRPQISDAAATTDSVMMADGGTGRRWIIWGGIVLPVIILAIVFGFTMYTHAAIDASQTSPAVTIDVTGRRWWWEVEYMEQGVTTANELRIPIGVPVQINLESADVIHSFWVPQLHGKMDAIPGSTNRIVIQADEAGVYRGECAEFCGLQHAHMGFMVVAESQEAFETWIAEQQQPAAAPSEDLAMRGQEVFLEAGCAYCHMVRGLDDSHIDASDIDLGPDLTHLNSRLTIAGATLTNNRGNLAGWIVDPQHIKPGVLMPVNRIESQDLQALLAYLESLN